MNLSIFIVFLKNKNIIFKIRGSKVTNYAALILASFLIYFKQIWVWRQILVMRRGQNMQTFVPSCQEGPVRKDHWHLLWVNAYGFQ